MRKGSVSPYLQFLVSLHRVESQFICSNGIESRDLKILELIAVRNWLNQPPKVTALTGLKEMGSPAVVHRSLLRLREANLVMVVQAVNDQRSKYLHPTPKSFEYFESLDLLMLENNRCDAR